ncbi:MAG: hypothetical protein ACTSYA_10000 [Candidatus Kariarchaeaceae archaeon]
MASEILMYMSILTIGVVAISSMTLMFTDFTNDTNDLAEESLLESVGEEVARLTQNIYFDGQERIEQGAQTFTYSISFSLPLTFHKKAYYVTIGSEIVHGVNVSVVQVSYTDATSPLVEIPLVMAFDSPFITGALASVFTQSLISFSYNAGVESIVYSAA